jgi:hypothetical protein
MSNGYHGAGEIRDPPVHTYGYLGQTSPGLDHDSAPKFSPAHSSASLAPRRANKDLPFSPASRYVAPSRKKLWKPALTIVGSLIAGCLLAIGHHVYYSNLHGKPIGTKVLGSVTDQKWASHVGTGLAFLTKFFFTLCVGAAFIEMLWKTARRPLGLSCVTHSSFSRPTHSRLAL